VEAVNVMRAVFCVRADEDGRYVYFRVNPADLPAVGDKVTYPMLLPERDAPFQAEGRSALAKSAIPNLPASAAFALVR
jgi:hypothetical protein